MSKELILDAIYRCHRIVNGKFGSDYKPQYYKPRTTEDVLNALEALLVDVKTNPRLIGEDIETPFCTEFGEQANDPWHPNFKVWMIGFSINDYEAICIPFDPDPYLIVKFGLTSIYEAPRILEIVMELAEMNCLHHSTSDALGLSRYGVTFKDVEDSMLVQYAIDDTAGDLGVDDLAKFHTEEGGFKLLDYPKAVPLEVFEWDKLANRCCHDVDIERRLFFILKEKAINENVWKAYTNVLKVSNMIGVEETINGVAINRPHLENVIKIEQDKQVPFLEEFYKRAEVQKCFDHVRNMATMDPKHKQIKKLLTVQTLKDITVSKPWLMEILLYDVCKFPCLNQTDKGARGTDADDLEKIKDKRPQHTRVIELLLEIKRINKKLSTYLLPFIEPKIYKGEELTQEEKDRKAVTGQVERYQYIKEDGFIHPRFHFHIARSGRSSSSDPNFQNQLGEVRLRMSFISRIWQSGKHGHLTMPDYDKHEVRMAAWQCQDPMMIKALETDIHIINQSIQAKLLKPSEILSVTKEKVKQLKNDLYIGLLHKIKHPLSNDIYEYPYQEIMAILSTDAELQIIAHEWELQYQKKRTTAKESTFGPLFGQQPPGYAASQGISIKEAEEVFAFDRETYPLKHKFAEKIKKEAREQGFVQSIFGKKRRLDYKAARQDKGKIAALDRQAVNTRLSQGPASDLTVLSMGKIMSTLKEYQLEALGCGTIHDSLVIDNAAEIQEQVNITCKTVMEEYPIELLGENQVRFKAEVKFGPSWGELKKWNG